MIYAMRSMRFERIFYGSDYPDRTVAETLGQSRQVMIDHGMTDEEMDAILYQNAKEFFAWEDI